MKLIKNDIFTLKYVKVAFIKENDCQKPKKKTDEYVNLKKKG